MLWVGLIYYRLAIFHIPLKNFLYASALGLETGLAGSIQASHIKALCKVKPSYLGFRGALCKQNKRILGLDPTKILSIKNMLY
jgi:uncharacterized protein (UPF0264 family)